jgi:hypothetical protein
MILTDEELALAYRAVLNQSIRPQDKSVIFKYALELATIEAAILTKLNSAEPVFIVFDGPPDHISPRFVEVETSAGFSVKAGEWNPYGDYWKLGPFFTTPQPDRTAELEAALREARESLKSIYSLATRNICSHDETHRGGAIWEICDHCEMQWADDEGGKPKFNWPKEIPECEKAIATIDKVLNKPY